MATIIILLLNVSGEGNREKEFKLYTFNIILKDEVS